MALLSIFGDYTENMQVMIDASQSRFAPTVFQNYFPWAPVQQSLDFTTLIGKTRIEAAASVVARDSKTPLRSRPNLDKLQGEIPAIKVMKHMTEKDYREYLAMQALKVADNIKKQQILDYIFNDIKAVGDAAMARLDMFTLQAISTGKIFIDSNTNPDGIALGEIDLLMSSDNKQNAAVSWSTSATATPLTDITNVVNAATAKGIVFAKLQMDRTSFILMAKTKEVIDSLVAFNTLQKGAAIATLGKINEYLVANQMPVIEIVEKPISIEKDGLLSSMNPFETTNISFQPAGPLGEMKHSIAIEQMRPVDKITYAGFNNALISKWSDNEPFQEWTKSELNAFPSFDAIDRVFLLSRTAAF